MLTLSFSSELAKFRCVAVDGDWLLYMPVTFRASCDVKVRNCTEIRPCVCCSVFSAEFIALFSCVSLFFFTL